MQQFLSALKALQIEDQAFVAEIQHCIAMPELAPFVHPTCMRELYDIFISLQAEQPPISLLLAETGLRQQSLLADFLTGLTDGIQAPNPPSRLKVLYGLYGKLGVDRDLLWHLLRSGAIHELRIATLKKVKQVYAVNIRAIADYWMNLPWQLYYINEGKTIGAEILLMLYPTSIADETPLLLSRYILEAMPALIRKFDGLNDFEPYDLSSELYLYKHHIDRVAEWFLVFQNHALCSDEGAKPDDPYYQMPFETIIRYVPPHIWWNNGVRFRHDEKKFHFGSPEFRFLATGGSVRKAPGLPFPFTRRMAREFVELPVLQEFDAPINLYFYLYAASLGAGDALRRLAGAYMRHRDDPEALQTELERWNPMIQKLSNPLFEAYDEEYQRMILGYVFHILRDQPLTNLTNLSFQQIVEAAEVYYTRIAERAEARLREQQITEAETQPEDAWAPHPTIKPWSDHKIFNIKELRSDKELELEGNIMGHCVASYTGYVKYFGASIWSLSGVGRKWVTIEVRNQTIVQARARFNAPPSDEHLKMIMEWARENKLTINL